MLDNIVKTASANIFCRQWINTIYIEFTTTTTTNNNNNNNMSGISAHVINIYGEIGSHCLVKYWHVIINRFR